MKKVADATELQAKQKLIVEKQAKIKETLRQIENSKKRQNDLLEQIKVARFERQEKQNTLSNPENYSMVELDIRNSQLISSVQLERKRWISNNQQENHKILGEDDDIKNKYQQIKSQQKPLHKGKVLKCLRKKLQLMQSLSKLKPQSGLYISHQRVLLKQYLEDIRQMNKQLEQSTKRYANIEEEYKQSSIRLRETVHNLKQILRKDTTQT